MSRSLVTTKINSKYTSGGGGTVSGISGSGTANQLTYFTGSTSIGSLTTATYPTLTELSYVKGVTSAIQTQLNNKVGSIGAFGDFTAYATGASITGSVLTLGAATTNEPGLMTTTTQSFAGPKTFITTIIGHRPIVAISPETAQFSARDSAKQNTSELRFQHWSDGDCYFSATTFSAVTDTSNLILRIASDGGGGTNNGFIKFNILASRKMAITPGGVTIGNSNTEFANGSALLLLAAGTANSGSAPLKLTSGTVMSLPETGAVEYNGTNLFFTRAGTTRETVWCGNTTTAPSSAAGSSFTAYYGSAASTVLGTPNAWASVNIGGTVYKIPLYT